MNNIKFSKIDKILQDARQGKIFVLVDDEARENEADLIIPASKDFTKINQLYGKVRSRTDMFSFESQIKYK